MYACQAWAIYFVKYLLRRQKEEATRVRDDTINIHVCPLSENTSMNLRQSVPEMVIRYETSYSGTK